MARNRYSLVEKLGEGGMGAVYTARDRLTQQTVALKQVILPPDQLRFNASNTTSDPYLSLALEFRTLAGLRHPHIISVLDYGFDDNGQPFFTMELLTNGKPITAVAKGQSLETQIRLINEMLLALSYLHRRGVLHRDLKPENVLVTATGQVKVLDFGIASDTGNQPVHEAIPAVTIAYMAPELFEGQPASVQSDLYAAGVIIYGILTGSYPFQSHNSLLLNDILHTVPDTSALAADVAVLLDSLLVLPEPLDEHFFTTLETEEPDMMQGKSGYERFILRRERAAGIQEGLLEGRMEGRVEGEAQVLQRQLTRRFGPLPQETLDRIKTATAAQLETWSLNFVDASTLDDVFRD